jgi:protein-L-isoaspartate(D-aspartate) O-methyltransferase
MNQTVREDSPRTSAENARHAMVDSLEASGRLTSPAVIAAMRVVPREAFVPGEAPLTQVYDADDAVITRRDEHGAPTSSVSAPHLQGRMIEQAGVGRGDTVLEIGSGGYNAALIAAVVGETGTVVSVDIDQWVTDRAKAYLAASGYGDRVSVVTADGALPVEGHGPFDAIVVTVGAWDISIAWINQLKPAGRLVVPLRMRSITRVVGFARDGSRLVSTSVEHSGFVPMQGVLRHDEYAVHLPDGKGHQLTLRFDEARLADPHQLDGVLATAPHEAWSGVVLDKGEDFADLQLWLACFLDGFCRVNSDPGSDLAAQMTRNWFPFGTAVGDSFAYFAIRFVDDNNIELGARAHGQHSATAADRLNTQFRAWYASGRGTEPTFAYTPHGSGHAAAPGDAVELVRQHGTITITWPPRR